MTPQQRSRQQLEKDGWTVATVEHWCSFSRRRKDLFEFADLFAIKADHPPLLVQVTSGSNAASRVQKIVNTPAAYTALCAGISIEVHGWRKLKVKRGGKAVRWQPRIVTVTKEDFPCGISSSPSPV